MKRSILFFSILCFAQIQNHKVMGFPSYEVICPDVEKTTVSKDFFQHLLSIYANTKVTDEVKKICREGIVLTDSGAIVRESCKKVRQWQSFGKFPLCGKTDKFYISLQDETKIECVFHDRGGDELVVVACGFGDHKEYFVPLLWMFPDKDILFFDYRGHGIAQKPDLRQKMLGLRFSPTKVRLGGDEETEVILATETIQKRKIGGYKKTIGVGFCFGASMMLKAQQQKKLFDVFIFDGCWPSSKDLIDRFFSNPGFIKNPRVLSNFITRALFSSSFIKYLARKVCENLIFKQSLDKKINTLTLMEKTKEPILFFHSKQDLLISNDDFEKILQANQNKSFLAILTPNKHLSNLTGGPPKELRKYVFKVFSNLFLNLPPKDIIEIIKNSEGHKEKINAILCEKKLDNFYNSQPSCFSFNSKQSQ